MDPALPPSLMTTTMMTIMTLILIIIIVLKDYDFCCACDEWSRDMDHTDPGRSWGMEILAALEQ